MDVVVASLRRCAFVALTLALVLGVTASAEAQVYSIFYSTSSDRSDPQDLDGATVVGDIFAFTTPDTDVDRVLFWFDNTAMSGTPDKTENNAPYDFKGGPSTAARPFDTTGENDSEHTLSARLELLDGSTVDVTATFTIANDEPPPPPPPELDFDPQVASLALDEGEQGSLSVDLDTNDGSTATPTLDENADWLTASLVGTTTPATVDLDFDSTGLAPGTYNATVTADATGYPTASLPVTLTVTLTVNGAGGSLYSVRMSTSADRSGDVPLDGQVVVGDIYVFTGPDTDVDRVIFYLDDPGQTGAPHRTENSPPSRRSSPGSRTGRLAIPSPGPLPERGADADETHDLDCRMPGAREPAALPRARRPGETVLSAGGLDR